MKAKYILALGFVMVATAPAAFAYGECSQYGIMSTYDSFGNTCRCMSGYIFGEGVLGQPYCVSKDSNCRDLYGYSARYNSLYDKCECGYGYVFGTSFTGRTQCVSGISECQSRHGFNVTYQDYDKSCVCNAGYTFDSSRQCVRKQNNVYFEVIELDTYSREAIIQSEYDRRYYHVRYGVGCLSGSFERYAGGRIVVNLGTDYDLDTWDTIVLFNHDQTCSVTYRARVDSSYSLKPAATPYVPVYVPTYSSTTCPANSYLNGDKCTCVTGYIANSSKDACVPQPATVPTKTVAATPKAQPTGKLGLTCDEGYSLSPEGTSCVLVPKNAHPVRDGRNSWLCDDGYVEVGVQCIPADSSLQPSPEMSAPDLPWYERLLRFLFDS